MDGRGDEEIGQREGEEVTVVGPILPSLAPTALWVLSPPQADAIYNMIGYPKFIMDPKELDKVFNDVSWSDVPWVSYSSLH